MKLYRKLVLFGVAASVLPFVVVGFSLLARSERALHERIAAQQAAVARELARLAGQQLDAVYGLFSDVGATFPPARLTDPEMEGMLALLCRRHSRVRAAGIFDAAGDPVVAPLACSGAGRAGPMGLVEVDRLRSLLPIEAAASGRDIVAVSTRGADGRPVLGVARSVEGRLGQRWVLGARFDLAPLEDEVEAAAGSAGTVALLDPEGRAVVASPGADPGPWDRDEARRLERNPAGTGVYRAGGVDVLGAWAPVPGERGWAVLLRLPATTAFAEVARMRREVVAVSLASLAALFLFAWLVLRRITRGLSRIDAAARDVARGDFSVRLPESGRDEVAEVSRAFNRMGEELSRARERQDRWSEDLQAKVEERTAELREAQGRLLEAQKLAAVGQLGAGVAHEINNPLTGILGQAQLLLERKRADDPDVPGLRRIEELSRRSREITANLLRFSQQRREPEFVRVDLNRVVRETLSLAEGQIRESGVALDLSLEERLPLVRGDATHLGHVLWNLLSNAQAACRERPGARVAVETRLEEGQVVLAVRDTGKGIPDEVRQRIFEPFFTTKEVWSNVGLGLSVSWRIVEEHGGHIAVESQVEQGSTFTVFLRAASGAA